MVDDNKNTDWTPPLAIGFDVAYSSYWISPSTSSSKTLTADGLMRLWQELYYQEFPGHSHTEPEEWF